MRPHRWQPTRLLYPWDSPGKNTGVGCPFLLQCVKVKSKSEVAQSCLTRSDPRATLPGSSVHGIFQARVLEWGHCALLFANSWLAVHQVSLSFTIFWSLLKVMSIESVMPSDHLTTFAIFSSCLLSFPASGTFPMSQLFTSHGQSIGALASASVLPVSIQG